MPNDELNLNQGAQGASQAGSAQGSAGAGAGDNSGGQGASGGAGGQGAGQGGGEDWRSQFIPADAEGRDKLLQGLSKFKSPVDLANSYLALQTKFYNQGGVRVPGANATPDEISAYHKAIGVPENEQGYKLNRPQGVAEAKEAEAAFMSQAYKAGLSQSQVDAVMGYYWGLEKAAGEASAAQKADGERIIAETRTATQTALDQMWGYAKDNNLGRINAFLAPHMPAAEDGKETNFLHLKLADGSYLGDNLALVKALDAAARVALGDGKFSQNDASDKALEDELSQLEGLRKTDYNKYKQPEVQARIQKLLAAKLGVA